MRVQGQIDGLREVTSDSVDNRIVTVELDDTGEGSRQAMKDVFKS